MSRLVTLINKQRELLKEMGLDSVARNLGIVQSRLEEDSFRVLITGEFNRGKSTLINAILGEEILASSLLRLPATNLIKEGRERAAWAGQPGNMTNIAIQDISDQHTRVELIWDTPLIQEGVELIEYPSMSEAPDKESFRNEVENADLVIVVVASDSLYSKVEADAVEQIIYPCGHRKLLFIANVFDRIAEKDQEEVKRTALVRLPVNEDRIFFVSAQNALDGEKEWQDGIEAVREKIQEEANNRKQLKILRLRQLAKDGLEQLEQEWEQSAQSLGEAAAVAKTQITDIRKKLQELQNLNSRIQRDLLNFRDGTRDVLQDKISSFNRDLVRKIESWGLEYQGDELAKYLNQKVKQAVLNFSEQDFTAYFQQRLKEQEGLLTNSITRYQQQLEYLYDLLPVSTPSVSIDIEEIELQTQLGHVELDEKWETGNSILKNFNFKNLRETPEAVMSIFGALLGSIIFSQFALLLIPAGLGATTFFLSRKGREQTKQENLQAYADQIRGGIGKWEIKVLEQVKIKIDTVQNQISTLFNETTQAAQQAAKVETSRLNVKNDAKNVKEQNLIQEIREALDD